MADQIQQNFVRVNPDGSVTFDFAVVADQLVEFPFGIDAAHVLTNLVQTLGTLTLESTADDVVARAGAQERVLINVAGLSDFLQLTGPAALAVDAGQGSVSIAANALQSSTDIVGHGLGRSPAAILFGAAHTNVNANLIAAVSLHYSNADADSFDVQARAAAAQNFARTQDFSWLAIG